MVRIVGSRRGLVELDKLMRWLSANVFGAPPFRNDRSAAGSAARQGPTALGDTSIRLAREISEPLRSDLVRWADWRSRDRPGTDGDEEAVQSTDLR
jgi:hypothetical protein